MIWSDYRAWAGSLCPLHVGINSRISLTDLLCVPCRQIGQLVPRWQLYRYGGNWCGAQGHPADSSRCLLEVPGLHWSSHVREIQRVPEQRRLSGDLRKERPPSVTHTGRKDSNVTLFFSQRYRLCCPSPFLPFSVLRNNLEWIRCRDRLSSRLREIPSALQRKMNFWMKQIYTFFWFFAT